MSRTLKIDGGRVVYTWSAGGRAITAQIEVQVTREGIVLALEDLARQLRLDAYEVERLAREVEPCGICGKHECPGHRVM